MLKSMHWMLLILSMLPLLSGSSLSVLSVSSFAEKTPDITKINAYVNAQMQKDLIPGLALGIVRGQQTVELRGFGEADPTGRPVTPQTPFLLGSISKSFTALAVMQLVQAGKVSLDAPVQRYLPWFQVGDLRASRQITIRQLLNQTSGLPTSAETAALAGTGTQTLEQYVRGLNNVVLVSSPGTAFNYSNANFCILGLIIQEVSGENYGTYIEQHVFAPLQMHQSFVSQQEAQDHGMATGERLELGTPLAANLPYLPAILPAGYLISSAEDMTHYLIAQNNGGSYNQTSVLAPSNVVLLHKPAALMTQNPATFYAMGWMVGPINGIPAVSHDGDLANFHADMALLPQGQWGIVVLINVNGAVPSLSGAYSSLIAGIVSILNGQQPPSTLNLGSLFLIIDTVIFLLMAGALWSLSRLLSRGRVSAKPKSLVWVRLRGAAEIVFPSMLLLAIPTILGLTWAVMLIYLADISLTLLVLCGLISVTGLLRIGKTFRPRLAQPALAR